jgi:hypothetical protein
LLYLYVIVYKTRMSSRRIVRIYIFNNFIKNKEKRRV